MSLQTTQTFTPKEKRDLLNNTLPLDNHIHQDIQAKIILLGYRPSLIKGIIDGSYSVYSFVGKSAINIPYFFDITFVSNDEIDIEKLLSTNVRLAIKDRKSILNQKDIYGKIAKISEDSIVGESTNKKYMYKIHLVSPLSYQKHTNRYEIYLDKKVPDIIRAIINRYTALLNLRFELKVGWASSFGNEDFKEYRIKFKKGGDLLLFTDVKKIPVYIKLD